MKRVRELFGALKVRSSEWTKVSSELWIRARGLRAVALVRQTFPFSAFGMVSLGAAIFGLTYVAIPRGDIVLFVLCVAAIALVGIALLNVALATLLLRKWLAREPDARPARMLRDSSFGRAVHEFETGFAIPSYWWLPLADVGVEWRTPKRTRVRFVRSGRTLTEVATASERGAGDSILRSFSVTDPFGLCSLELENVEDRCVRWFPAQGRLSRMALERSMSDGGELPHPHGSLNGEPVDMREYVYGDPLRFVLWKVFARTRELVVRTPERALSPIKRTVAYMVVGARDDASAGAALAAIRAKSLGQDWVLGADGVLENARHEDLAADVLARSGEVHEDVGGTGLGAFLTRNLRGVAGGRAVVFVPAAPGPWIERVVRIAHAQRASGTCSLEVVVGCDELPPVPLKKDERLRGAARRWMQSTREWFFETSRDEEQRSEVDEVVRALRGTGAKISVADRVSGTVRALAHDARPLPRAPVPALEST